MICHDNGGAKAIIIVTTAIGSIGRTLGTTGTNKLMGGALVEVHRHAGPVTFKVGIVVDVVVLALAKDSQLAQVMITIARRIILARDDRDRNISVQIVVVLMNKNSVDMPHGCPFALIGHRSLHGSLHSSSSITIIFTGLQHRKNVHERVIIVRAGQSRSKAFHNTIQDICCGGHTDNTGRTHIHGDNCAIAKSVDDCTFCWR
jgi:hypothetical protein